MAVVSWSAGSLGRVLVGTTCQSVAECEANQVCENQQCSDDLDGDGFGEALSGGTDCNGKWKIIRRGKPK